MSPVLTTLAAILRDAVDGYDSEARTLSRLRAGSFTPDPALAVEEQERRLDEACVVLARRAAA